MRDGIITTGTIVRIGRGFLRLRLPNGDMAFCPGQNATDEDLRAQRKQLEDVFSRGDVSVLTVCKQ